MGIVELDRLFDFLLVLCLMMLFCIYIRFIWSEEGILYADFFLSIVSSFFFFGLG